MGGTTAKICLIDNGQPLKGRAFEVDRQSRFKKGSGTPLRIPVIEMVEIGAGGGSIARVDALQRIQVGPDSAGAEPGPACYGRGGREPTVTDADVAIGKIDIERFAGGKIALHPDQAEAALAATFKGMSAEQGADRHRRDRRREHGQRRARACGGARRGDLRAHADRLRWCRPPARQPACREARHQARDRAARCRRRIGRRLPGGAGRLRDDPLALHAPEQLRCRCRQCPDRCHGAGGAHPLPRRGRGAARVACAARRSCAMPARATRSP